MNTPTSALLVRESHFKDASSAASTIRTSSLFKQPQKIQSLGEKTMSAQMLKIFTKKSTIAQKKQIRSLVLKHDLPNNDPVETAFLPEQFNNLQHLKLEIFRGLYNAFDDASLSPVDERDTRITWWRRGASNRWVFLIIQLRKLPVESVEIILPHGTTVKTTSYNNDNLDPCSFYSFGLNGNMRKKTNLTF